MLINFHTLKLHVTTAGFSDVKQEPRLFVYHHQESSSYCYCLTKQGKYELTCRVLACMYNANAFAYLHRLLFLIGTSV